MPPRQKEVFEWLENLGLATYLSHFVEKGFDSMLVVRHIIAEDLDCMKITLPGHRKTILLAVEILNRQPLPPFHSLPSLSLSFDHHSPFTIIFRSQQTNQRVSLLPWPLPPPSPRLLHQPPPPRPPRSLPR